MMEKGVMDSIKEGGVAGAAFGASIASARLFLFEHAAFAPENQLSRTASDARAEAALSSTSSAASRNALLRTNVLPQLAKTTTAYAGLGALFVGTETMLRNSRDKEDVWNSIIAGAVTGSTLGLRSGRFFVSAGAAAAMAGCITIANIFNNTLGPVDKDYMSRRAREVLRE